MKLSESFDESLVLFEKRVSKRPVIYDNGPSPTQNKTPKTQLKTLKATTKHTKR